MPMVGRTAAAYAGVRKHQKENVRHCGPNRARVALESAAEMTRGLNLIKKYDDDASGMLEHDDLKNLLTDMNYGKPVSDDEVKFMLDSTDTSADGAINVQEMQMLLMVWNTYQRQLPEIEALMETYDEDRSGRLEREELEKMLTQLNDGRPVKKWDVDFVVKEAGLLAGDGTIGKPEVKRAIRAWYTAVDVRQQSQCCTVQ
mmetsp:Transcript_2256/g.4194  ORF Transcript_2256/g.4194 Transcript_2256/m.4194 type:complete len:201 (-) Transcript_2256:33-635(-)